MDGELQDKDTSSKSRPPASLSVDETIDEVRWFTSSVSPYGLPAVLQCVAGADELYDAYAGLVEAQAAQVAAQNSYLSDETRRAHAMEDQARGQWYSSGENGKNAETQKTEDASDDDLDVDRLRHDTVCDPPRYLRDLVVITDNGVRFHMGRLQAFLEHAAEIDAAVAGKSPKV